MTIKEQHEEKLEIFAKIFSNTIEAIVITDLEGNILQVNDAFTTMTYYTAEEVLGQNIRLLRSYKHTESLYQTMWDTVLANRVWQGEVWNKKKDGSLYPALLIIHPIINRDNQISHLVAIQHDISILKQINSQERHEELCSET